jgi:hypothetical protein
MTLQKLTPNQDLQCFFFEPSGGGAAIAALSSTTETGFTVSGTFRQQFDWAVVEWNRDNTHEHPAFRYLPDGDLSEVVLTYDETRTNCIATDSDLFPTVDWPWLRVWGTATGETTEKIWWVPLQGLATAIEGSYQCAYADFTLSGSLSDGDFVGLAYLQEQYTYQVVGSGHSLADAVVALTTAINGDPLLRAVQTGETIRVYYTGGTDIASSTTGANGNRFSMYTFATGTESWDAPSKTFANGTSPSQWQVTIDFSTLQGSESNTTIVLEDVPTYNIRKMRWTYAADLQTAAYERSEFQVVISNWTVTGSNLGYSVAGTGSRRVEDDAIEMTYVGTWTESRGNYSGGTIHYASATGASVTFAYQANLSHSLYVGTRYTGSGAAISFNVDGAAAGGLNLFISGEDVLIRWPVGTYSAGSHTIVVTHAGPTGADFYFDFIELAVPSSTLPTFPDEPKLTLATDWDTEHSLALAPERTAWMIDSLGFTARQNHYAGALWFYELVNPSNVYATGAVTFTGTPAFSDSITVTIGSVGVAGSDIPLTKLVHEGMTTDMLALAFANELNRGYTAVWASASGSVLTTQSRSLGSDGNSITLAVSPSTLATASADTFAGGMDGTWLTDLTSMPRLNRAARDWHASFFAALEGYGIDSTSSFSMELGNGDPSASAGIAQVGPAGDPILLPTPSLQTNFSPTSLAFWQEAYEEMAALQLAAGLVPFLQFGEVQWWYFPTDGARHSFSGMPFYDAWNQSQFEAEFGTAMTVFTTNTVNPASYPNEGSYLPEVIGNFTNAIMTFVRASQSDCRFEVLYPTDTNQTAFNQVFNFPVTAWTPSALTILKTENFGFTLERNLDAAEGTMEFGESLGFQATQRSQLVGVSDSTTAWIKEVETAVGKGFESVVIFALDQYCLIGYATPLPGGSRRSLRMG